MWFGSEVIWVFRDGAPFDLVWICEGVVWICDELVWLLRPETPPAYRSNGQEVVTELRRAMQGASELGFVRDCDFSLEQYPADDVLGDTASGAPFLRGEVTAHPR